MEVLVTPLSTRQEEILQAASKLFSEKGYEGASMRDLADALAIKPASLYSHYRAKDEILWEIARRCAQAFLSEAEPLAVSGVSAASRLELLLQGHITVMMANRTASAVFFREWRNLPEPRRSEFAALIARYEGCFLRVLEEGMETGAIVQAPVQLVMRSLLAATNWLPKWYLDSGSLSLAAITQELSHSLLHGWMRPPLPE